MQLRRMISRAVGIATVTILAARATPAGAFGLGLGLAAVEEGDSNLRPAATAAISYTDSVASSLYYFGRDFGPVKERTVLATLVRQAKFSSVDRLQAAYGVFGAYEATSLYEGDGYSTPPERDVSYNFGGVLGLRFDLFPSGPFHVACAWDSHLAPAGGAVLLLTFARWTTVSLIAAVDL